MTATGLWLTVVGSGIFHGVNPAMGWPLAVSAGLMGGGRRGLFGALGKLALGHLLAMASLLLPFSLMAAILPWQSEIRLGAAFAVIAFGVALLVRRRHPRFLARIRPTQLTLWSVAIATAHGAGLMLVPIYLGVCHADGLDPGQRATGELISGNLGMAVMVSVVHTAAMISTGGLLALLVDAWLGLGFLSRLWFNLDVAWASGLMAVGGVALADAWLGGM